MSSLKTRPNPASVEDLLGQLADPQKRADCQTLIGLLTAATQAEPVLWGETMIGFGSYQYRYESGHSGEFFLIGFAPRKQNLVLYLMDGFMQHDQLLAKLGKHTLGKACLYLKRLEDIDLTVLQELIRQSVKAMRENHPSVS